MLEALEGFVLVFSAEQESSNVLYVSESVTSLMGYLPRELLGR